MPTEPIVVLYCVDDAYVAQAAISLASLLDNAPGDRFEVIVAAFQRDPALSQAIFAPMLEARPNCVLRFVDLDDGLFGNLPVTRNFSRSIYIRLILQRFVEPHYRRLLYLDADTIACRNVAPLWQADLGDATLAAVADPFHQDPVQIGFTQDEPYFNSGVLLIDMQRWRARDCERRVFDILARRGHELTWMDQDALNMALRGEVRHIHLSDFAEGKEHRLPGRGVLPLDLFLLALAEAGYDRVITIELTPDALEAGDDDEVRDRLHEAVAFCREALGLKSEEQEERKG